ncbi:hypothetical protein CUMW_248300 [Citrus unshiu]|uniref:Uncharacterized protein n=1 Tax=Citrus unshiu TaxID=55188 RepID=A0A2H5QP38_CITUN|nr:hypothetical protein CUMW_248300 [Citrus unshiu]
MPHASMPSIRFVQALEMLFHDSCDVSILFDDSFSIVNKKNALLNFKLAKGFKVIDNVKS